jgi:hypothetical protein
MPRFDLRTSEIRGGFAYFSASIVVNEGKIYTRPAGFGTRSLGQISSEVLGLNFEDMFTYSHHIL